MGSGVYQPLFQFLVNDITFNQPELIVFPGSINLPSPAILVTDYESLYPNASIIHIYYTNTATGG